MMCLDQMQNRFFLLFKKFFFILYSYGFDWAVYAVCIFFYLKLAKKWPRLLKRAKFSLIFFCHILSVFLLLSLYIQCSHSQLNFSNLSLQHFKKHLELFVSSSLIPVNSVIITKTPVVNITHMLISL